MYSSPAVGAEVGTVVALANRLVTNLGDLCFLCRGLLLGILDRGGTT